MAKFLFLLAFLLVYLFFGLELGYTATSPWWTHITYAFQHANLMHLITNSISFYVIFGTLRRITAPWKITLLALTVSFLASYLSLPFGGRPEGAGEVATVGASGMIYAMIGMFLTFLTTRRIQYRTRRALLTFLSLLALSLILGFFKHNSASLLHLACLACGMAFSLIYIILKEIK